MRKFFIYPLAWTILFIALQASAELYKWVDEDGKVHFTNTVPPVGVRTFKSSREVIEDPEERAVRIERERYEAELAAQDRAYKDQMKRERINSSLELIRQREVEKNQRMMDEQEEKRMEERRKIVEEKQKNAAKAIAELEKHAPKNYHGNKRREIRDAKARREAYRNAELAIEEGRGSIHDKKPRKNDDASSGSLTGTGSGTTYSVDPHGAVNTKTGERLNKTAGGMVGTKDGTFYQETAGGYINTKTGEFIDK